MRQPGIEPGSHRWQRRILTIEPLALILYMFVFVCVAPSGARTLDPRYIRPMRYRLRQWSYLQREREPMGRFELPTLCLQGKCNEPLCYIGFHSQNKNKI